MAVPATVVIVVSQEPGHGIDQAEPGMTPATLRPVPVCQVNEIGLGTCRKRDREDTALTRL